MSSKLLLTAALMLIAAGCSERRKADADPKRTPDVSGLGAKQADPAYVQSFMGSCVQNLYYFDRIEAAARVSKWKRVTDPDALRTIGPADGDGEWKAWTFRQHKRGYLLAIGTRDIEKRSVRVCVLIAEPADPVSTREHIAKLLHANLRGHSQESGQSYTIYSFQEDGADRLLNFVDGVPMGMKALTTSIMADAGAH